jgi:hypothetical protein
MVWYPFDDMANVVGTTRIISTWDCGYNAFANAGANYIQGSSGNQIMRGRLAKAQAYNGPRPGTITGRSPTLSGVTYTLPLPPSTNWKPLSVCGWVYFNSGAGATQDTYWELKDNSNGWTLGSNGLGRFQFIFTEGASGDNATGATTQVNGVWYHVTGTWDGTTGSNSLKLYVNAVLDGQADAQGIPATNTIGHGPDVNTGDAYVDDVRTYWNRILSVGDIRGIMAEAFYPPPIYKLASGVVFVPPPPIPLGLVGWAACDY